MSMGMPTAQAQDAASLRARHGALGQQMDRNPFQRPLHLESIERGGEVQGDLYARLDRPYSAVGPALRELGDWCDILILHLNVKSCRASTPGGGDTLSLNIGRKFDQPLADTYRFEFLYRVVAATPDYLQVALDAEHGPVGTSRYRIVFEVVALDSRQSFLHLSYAYRYGIAARVAMQAYLASAGRNKVGFSTVAGSDGGQPAYIRGTRGAVERNTMRYFLAIDAYLGALSAPASMRVDKRLNDWHAAVERYPRQLHELSHADYMNVKRGEIQRQRAPASAAASK